MHEVFWETRKQISIFCTIYVDGTAFTYLNQDNYKFKNVVIDTLTIWIKTNFRNRSTELLLFQNSWFFRVILWKRIESIIFNQAFYVKKQIMSLSIFRMKSAAEAKCEYKKMWLSQNRNRFTSLNRLSLKNIIAYCLF